MSLLKKNITRKRRVNKLLELEPEQKLDVKNDKKYKLKPICNSEVYAKEVAGQLPRLYYLIS